MIQFNALLAQLDKEVEWAIQMVSLPLVGKISDPTAHPLHPGGNVEERRANKNTSSTIGGFVTKLNSLVKSR